MFSSQRISQQQTLQLIRPMRLTSLLARTAMLAVLASASGCASTGADQLLADARQFATRATAAGSDFASRTTVWLERQAQDTDLLKKFHDAGEHGEQAILAILRKAGIGSGDSGARSAKGAKPARSGQPQRIPDDAVLASGPGDIRWPVDAGIISSEFGARWGRQHHGIDIAGRIGEPILAAADGEVIHAGGGLTGYGQTVILRHAGQVTTLYAHNSEVKVRVGDRVTRGEVIALLGSTGHSTGPHVHFEVRHGKVAVDPRDVLPTTTKLARAFPTRVASR